MLTVKSKQATMNQIYDWLAYMMPTKIQVVFFAILSYAFAVLQSFLGGIDTPIQALLIFAVADYLTGTANALKSGNWTSAQGFKGVSKKAFMFVIVGLCHWADKGLQIDALRNGAIALYILTEFGSMVENFDGLGHGHLIPSWVRSKLKLLRESKERGNEHE